MCHERRRGNHFRLHTSVHIDTHSPSAEPRAVAEGRELLPPLQMNSFGCTKIGLERSRNPKSSPARLYSQTSLQ